MINKKRIGFNYAINGLIQLVKQERNFQIHIIFFLFVCIAGIILSLSLTEWGFIIIVSGIVLITEALNSVIEKMMDFIEPNIHPTVKIIKDMAAGSVLLAAILAFITGLLIFIPKLNTFFSSVILIY